MSIPTSIGDGPHGPEPLITVSKRTAILFSIAAVSIIFALTTIVWVMWSAYRGAVHDRNVANATSSCARQINADSVATIGTVTVLIGKLDSQLGTTIKTLVTPDTTDRAAAFTTEAGKLQPIADDLANQSQVLNEQLNRLQQVNTLCSDGKAE